MKRLKAYLLLMRLHRPVPILLLLWPTYWSLFYVSKGFPSIKLFIIFTLGVIIMRTCGCIINDISDRDFDKNVKRTEMRPLTTGEIRLKSAWILFIILSLIAFVLVLFLNWISIIFSFGAIVLTVIYPLCKRFFALPQLVLGAAFNYGILMASTAVIIKIPPSVWLLYFAAIIWTLAYDTIYALADKPYDIKLGLKSSAVTFGSYDLTMILTLQQITLGLILLFGGLNHYNFWFYLTLIIAEFLFIRQYKLYKKRQINSCIKAFSDNHWVGFFIFLGIVIQYL